MKSSIHYKFLQQQGFPHISEETSRYRVRALQFQPSIIGLLVLVAILIQSWPLFLILSALLWVNVTIPRANIFENFYNAVFIHYNQLKIKPAPGPRRFAQGMAAVFTLGAAVSILTNWVTAAIIFQGLLVVAFGVLLLGNFCLGSYLFHLLKGETFFANATCPWSP